MNTPAALLGLVKSLYPVIKSKVKSLAAIAARKFLYSQVIKFVKSMEESDALRGIDLPEEEIAEYIVMILLGEEIKPKMRNKVAPVAELIRAGVHKTKQ